MWRLSLSGLLSKGIKTRNGDCLLILASYLINTLHVIVFDVQNSVNGLLGLV